MAMSVSLLTACGQMKGDMTSEELSQAVEEIEDTKEEVSEDIEEAKEDISEAAEDISDAVDKASDDVTDDNDISGSWQDDVSKRAMMDVQKQGDGSYNVVINWGGSAFETATWEFNGKLIGGVIEYDDCHYGIYTYDEDGNVSVSDEQTTKGSLTLEGEHLRWKDSMNAEDGLFTKTPDEYSFEDEVEVPAGDEPYISPLPDYVYKGSDPIIAAITQYMIVEFEGSYPDCDISIPCPIVVATDDSDVNDVKVYGNFWLYNYNLNDDTLLNESGGAYPGCFHIKKTDSGCEILSFDVVADGADYDESAKQIFGDNYDKFVEVCGDTALAEKTRTEFISDYVKSHDLAITKYQDSGWDPVTLP